MEMSTDNNNTIPVNPDVILIDSTTSRFSSAIWYEKIQDIVVTLAGVGGIGSNVAYLLARMHPKSMFIYDPDTVELVNMSGQMYSTDDVSSYKVDAISHTMSKFCNYRSAFAINKEFTEECEASDIMICGFDNMKARRVFFNKWLELVKNKPAEMRKDCLFIDGRLAAEKFQVLCIKGDDDYSIERYQKEFLFTDEEADEDICSYKQTTFAAMMIASVMVNLLVNFVANQCNPIIERYLPFFTYYNAETLFFKTEL